MTYTYICIAINDWGVIRKLPILIFTLYVYILIGFFYCTELHTTSKIEKLIIKIQIIFLLTMDLLTKSMPLVNTSLLKKHPLLGVL